MKAFEFSYIKNVLEDLNKLNIKLSTTFEDMGWWHRRQRKTIEAIRSSLEPLILKLNNIEATDDINIQTVQDEIEGLFNAFIGKHNKIDELIVVFFDKVKQYGQERQRTAENISHNDEQPINSLSTELLGLIYKFAVIDDLLPDEKDKDNNFDDEDASCDPLTFASVSKRFNLGKKYYENESRTDYIPAIKRNILAMEHLAEQEKGRFEYETWPQANHRILTEQKQSHCYVHCNFWQFYYHTPGNVDILLQKLNERPELISSPHDLVDESYTKVVSEATTKNQIHSVVLRINLDAKSVKEMLKEGKNKELIPFLSSVYIQQSSGLNKQQIPALKLSSSEQEDGTHTVSGECIAEMANDRQLLDVNDRAAVMRPFR